MNSTDDAPDTPAPQAAYRRALGGLTLSLLASWLLMLSPLPYSILAGVTALVAGVFLVLVALRGWKEGRRTTAVVAVVFGIPAVGLIVLSSVTSAVFYQPMVEMEECRSSAITEQAKAECQAEATSSVSSWVSRILGG